MFIQTEGQNLFFPFLKRNHHDVNLHNSFDIKEDY